jgi:hypothetical protein
VGKAMKVQKLLKKRFKAIDRRRGHNATKELGVCKLLYT